MNIEEFKQRLLDHYRPTLVKITSEAEKRNMEDFRLLKGLTESMDFDCRIKKAGGCKSYPDRVPCCCEGCADSVGYLDLVEYNDLGYYARRFGAKVGFWRKDGGCILPHKMRSVVCVTYHCRTRTADQDFERGMSLFVWHLRQLRQALINGGKIVKK